MRRKAMKWFVFPAMTMLLANNLGWAHGFVGQRFFPATITIDDPIPGDEFDVTTFVTQSPGDDGGNVWTTNPIATWNKRITPNLQTNLAASYLHIHNPDGMPTQNGFDDWSVGFLYEFYSNATYESVLSFGINADIGGTGSHIVDADSHTTFSPGLFFGQGFGALPDGAKYLRPFAITGVISPGFTTGHYRVTSVDYGLAIMYSLPYMQAFVTSFASAAGFMNHVVPVVELPMNTCTEGDCSGQTTGTINPGILTVWKFGQVSFEGVIPMNSRTGNKVGAVFQLHFYLDDIFPNSFLGQPIFN